MATLFNATNEYLRRTANLPDYNSDYTIMFWWRFETLPTTGVQATLFVLDNGTGFDVLYVPQTTNAFTLNSNPAGAGGSYGTAATGTWVHLAVRRNGTALQVLFDGVQQINLSASVGARSAATEFQFGNASNFGGGSSLQSLGRIAGVKHFDAALSDAEVRGEMVSLIPKRYSNLVSWWPMLAGERTRDYGPNQRSWTEGGTLSDAVSPPVPWGIPIVAVVPLAPGSGDASLTPTDSASLTEGVTADASVPAADSLGLTENILITSSVAGVDSATLSESAVVTAAVPVTDTGSLGEAVTADAALALTDTATESDSSDVSTPVTASDSASLSESVAVTADVPVVDSAALSEGVTADAALALTDTGTAGDSSDVLTGTQKNVSDSASLSEGVTVDAQVSASDAGTLGESITPDAALDLSDTATGGDSSSIAAGEIKTLSDAFALTEVLTVAAALTLADESTLADAVGDRLLELAESAYLSEILSLLTGEQVNVGPALRVPQRGGPMAVPERHSALAVDKRSSDLTVSKRSYPLFVENRSQ